MALEDDVQELARRVALIERQLGIGPSAAAAASAPPVRERQSLGNLPHLIGRALLGLAGAYLLRALTESGTLAAQSGVGAGILYAILWLVWAARTAAGARVETALHSLTAVLVLAPLLWEAVIRFHAVSSWAAAAILLFFTGFALAISWRKNLLILATIGTVAGLGTAAALLVATHDVLPFTLLFLAIAAAVETSACLEHWLSERWLAASAADLAVLLATWLVTNDRGLPPGYAPIPHAALLAALVLLLAIYLSSTIVRTLLRGFTFTFFETAQCAFAVAIALNGCLRLSEEAPGIAPAIGTLAALCAAACYVLTLVLREHGRNFYTYSTFGILLAVVGTRILLPLDAVSVLWLLLAAACAWAGRRYGRQTLGVHGAVYLSLALICLGAFQQATSALLGTSGVQWAAVAGAVAAAVCYGLSGPGWLRLALGGMLVLLGAGLAAAALTHSYHALLGLAASHSYCATLRTSVLAGGALALAWARARWQRVELGRLMYPLMLLAAYRLIADDIHQDRKAAAVISLLVYGAVMMTIPRMTKRPVAGQAR